MIQNHEGTNIGFIIHLVHVDSNTFQRIQLLDSKTYIREAETIQRIPSYALSGRKEEFVIPCILFLYSHKI